MGYARKNLVSLQDTAHYHCIGRCLNEHLARRANIKDECTEGSGWCRIYLTF